MKRKTTSEPHHFLPHAENLNEPLGLSWHLYVSGSLKLLTNWAPRLLRTVRFYIHPAWYNIFLFGVALESFCNIAVQVLEQKALCQQDPDQEETEEAPEDQAEYDSVLVSSAGDLVSALANALGLDFVRLFSTFHPLISKYYVSIHYDYNIFGSYLRLSIQKESRSLSDRSSAIGCLAEIIAGMKSAVTPYTEPLMELFYKALSDPEPEVQSNACFAVGLLIEHSGVDLSPQYLALLAALRPIFDVPPNASAARLNAKDNAAGSVSRMIVHNTAAVPLDQVIPVLVAALPLKNDQLENRPVFRAIFHLFRTNPQSLGPHLDHLLAVFAYVLDPMEPDQISDDARAELIQLIGYLNTEEPGKVQAAGLGAFLPGA